MKRNRTSTGNVEPGDLEVGAWLTRRVDAAKNEADETAFEAAFEKRSSERNLRKGAPRKSSRDEFIVRFVDKASQDGAPRWHDNKKSAVTVGRRTKSAASPAELQAALGGIRFNPSVGFKPNAFVLAAMELNRMGKEERDYLTGILAMVADEDRADAQNLIDAVETEIKPGTVKDAHYRHIRAEKEKNSPQRLKAEAAKRRRMGAIEARIKLW